MKEATRPHRGGGSRRRAATRSGIGCSEAAEQYLGREIVCKEAFGILSTRSDVEHHVLASGRCSAVRYRRIPPMPPIPAMPAIRGDRATATSPEAGLPVLIPVAGLLPDAGWAPACIECGRTAYGTLSPYGYVAETATEIIFRWWGPRESWRTRTRSRCSTRCKGRQAVQEPCRVEWVDEQGVRHGCVRWSDEHKRAHHCGCGQELPR